jgi:hypothetical protein
MSNEHHTLAGTRARQYLGERRHLVNGGLGGKVGEEFSGFSVKAAKGGLRAKAGSAADKAASSLVKPQKTMRRFRNPNTVADPHADVSFEIELFGVRAARRCEFAEPQWTRGAEIDAIHAVIDMQSLR